MLAVSAVINSDKAKLAPYVEFGGRNLRDWHNMLKTKKNYIDLEFISV